MKKSIGVTVLFLLFGLMGTTVLTAASKPLPFTSLRGGVYEDADGDGQCSPSDGPLAGVDMLFTHDDTELKLFTGSNGTYGLVEMGPGNWTIRVDPAERVRVTSAPARNVTVNLDEARVITDINFCAQPLSGFTSSIPAEETTSSSSSGPVTIFDELAEQNLFVPPADDFSQEAAAVRAEISEELLSDPEPESEEIVAELAKVLEEEPVLSGEPWLDYLNNFRSIGQLPLLQESEELSLGAELHSRYMVVSDRPISHNEDTSSPLYSEIGARAAKNSDIFATTQLEATYVWAINFWISGPFHLVPILDPAMNQVGYGQHNQDIGNFKMAGVLDVLSSRGNIPANTEFPLMFPADGEETWVLQHSLFEWPDPLASCPGFARPTGAPIVIQMGDGSGSPRVNSAVLSTGGVAQDVCVFTESTYFNGETYAQQTGRLILDERDAVVILPRSPLAVNSTYQVDVVVDGESYSWSFDTVSSPGN